MMDEKYILIMVTDRFALIHPPEIHDTFEGAYASLVTHAKDVTALEKHEYDLKRFNYAMYRVDKDLNVKRIMNIPYVNMKAGG